LNNEQKIEIFRNNLAAVQARIAAAAAAAGRLPDSVTLVAVTKYVDAEITSLLVDAGATVLGENRPQVLDEKFAALSGRSIDWHLIGHLQTNKVKKVVRQATLIHSVDSVRLIDAIEKHSISNEIKTHVLLEVNVSGEPAKHGIAPDELPRLLDHCRNLSAVKVAGLMCMAGLGGDASETRTQFALLRQLRNDHQNDDCPHVSLKELSMGMSGDFEMAIEEGATLVRVGSILFEGIDR
jgi:pyridoxal phosphate enzyme (YggS family)